MKQASLLTAVFIAIVSVCLFSGQMQRPFVPPPQQPQRQQPQRQPTPTPQQPQRQPTPQRQAVPPRPQPVNQTPAVTTPTVATPTATIPTVAIPTVASPAATMPTVATPAVATPTAEMPSLFWLPEDIEKEFSEAPQGATRTIILFGDPRVEGLYVTRTFIPRGTRTIPHFHPDSRTVTVISGTCYYGRGDVFDEERMVAMPPGSFFTEPAGVPHFIWAKDGDVVVQTTAIGPSGTQIVR